MKEPLMAVAISMIWGICGGWYFIRNSKKKGEETILGWRERLRGLFGR